MSQCITISLSVYPTPNAMGDTFQLLTDGLCELSHRLRQKVVEFLAQVVDTLPHKHPFDFGETQPAWRKQTKRQRSRKGLLGHLLAAIVR
jgi:hypothetical protein